MQFQEQGTGTDFYPLLVAALSEAMRVRGQIQPAMRLAGAAAAFEDMERTQQANALFHYNRTLAAARARLSDPALAAAWAEGQRMTLDQAVAYALQGDKADG